MKITLLIKNQMPMSQKKTIKQIGYSPTTIEDEKINLICNAYLLTRVNVIRNLIYSHKTLDELYQEAMMVIRTTDNPDVNDESHGNNR